MYSIVDQMWVEKREGEGGGHSTECNTASIFIQGYECRSLPAQNTEHFCHEHKGKKTMTTSYAKNMCLQW